MNYHSKTFTVKTDDLNTRTQRDDAFDRADYFYSATWSLTNELEEILCLYDDLVANDDPGEPGARELEGAIYYATKGLLGLIQEYVLTLGRFDDLEEYAAQVDRLREAQEMEALSAKALTMAGKLESKEAAALAGKTIAECDTLPDPEAIKKLRDLIATMDTAKKKGGITPHIP